VKINRVIDFGDGNMKVCVEVLRVCQILGVKVESLLESVIRQAWKAKSISREVSGGGEEEAVVELHLAKDCLLSWLWEHF
jgi:hypothetical protein